MPQAAQQDYIIIRPKDGRMAQSDALAIMHGVKCYLNNTIFDVLFAGEHRVANYSIDGLKRVTMAGETSDGIYIDVLIANVGAFLYPNVKIYESLSKVQIQQDSIKGSVMTELPSFAKTSGILWARNTQAQGVLVTEDGFAYNVNVSSSRKITSISKSSTTAEEAKAALSLNNVIVLSENDSANLIGCGCFDND